MSELPKSRYKILRKLGQGGMGEVFLAEDQSLGRKVALKFLPPSSESDETARRRLLQEARAAAGIDHPYICKIYETGELDGKAFIGMEFIEGETLRDRLLRSRLPWKEALRIGQEISEALARAHERGLVHRDLKPSNIMLTADDHVKVTDFGLAKRVLSVDARTLSESGLTGSGALLGTLTYMSPEQLRAGRLDQRSDIFALGVILYEMIAGVHPFDRHSAMETAAAILRHTPPPVSHYCADLPAVVDDIVERMLGKEVSDRYASTSDLCADLRRVLERSAEMVALPRLERALAVLPFVNRSPDKETEYFSDGITEDIIAEVSKIRELKVISRSSVMRYKGTDRLLREIAGELGVQTLLEGSVRQSGNRVRIVTTLVDVRSDTQLWAETYDRNIEDVFAIQTEVAQQIAVALKASLTVAKPERPKREQPQHIEAYHLYLKGRYFLNKLTPDSLMQAIRFFQQGLDLDPTDARAYAGMSTCYAHAGHFSFLPCEEAFPKAKAAARQALELNDDLPEAHASMGVALLFYEWDWTGAETEFKRAIELNANFAEGHLFYSWLLTARLRFEEAIAEARVALRLDPLSLLASTNLGWVLGFSGHFDQSLDQLQKTLEMDANFLPPHSIMSYVYQLKGMHKEALEIIEQWHWSKAHLGQAQAMAGCLEAARRTLAEVTDPSQKGRASSVDIALLYLLLGELDEGLNWLEQAYCEHDNQFIYLKNYFRFHPELQRYASDPRLAELFQRVGLAA